jgi:hypothetical protein
MSIIAIERKRVPENVIATSMTALFLKQSSVEMQLPNIVTSKKKVAMSAIFNAIVLSM